MKKLIAIVMTLVLTFLCCVAVPASAGSTPTFVWEDCAIQLLSYKIVKSQYSSAYMDLYTRVLNNKDYKISLWLRNADMDGVEVVVGPILFIEPHSDTGTEDPVSLYIFAPSDNKEGASNAIASGRTLSGTLELENDETDEVLLSQKISIELDVLDGVRDVATPKPTNTPTPKPTATPKPVATPAPDNNDYGNNPPPYNPASWNFTGLKQGSKGQAVKDLQQRLTDLGYMNYKVDGEYGLSTAIAVMSFCSQNGLYIQPDATPEMQTLLYSSGAQYYEEPWVPLIFGPSYRWERSITDVDIGTFYIDVVNRSNRKIRGYELYYYFTDVWGNKYQGSGSTTLDHRRVTSIDGVKSGYCVDSVGILLDPYSWIYAVHVAIHRIVFDDGEIREVADKDLNYWTCPIRN